MQDGSSLAKELRIPIGEACRYLKLQFPIGRFGARIERQESETFSGMHITYEPYGIVILGVTPTFDYEEHLSPQLEEIRDTIVYRQVEYTLDELSRAQAQASRAAPHIPFDSWLDIKTNKVFLRAESQEDARRLEAVVRDGTFAVPAEAFVVEVGPLAQQGIDL